MPRSERPVDLRELDDEDLMALVGAGEALAFEVTFGRHSGAAFSLACRMCGHRSIEEDVAQESFLSLWRSGARHCSNRGSVRTWTLGIVRNRAIDALRREAANRRNIFGDGWVRTSACGTEAEVVRREQARAVRKALRGLPAEQLQVIELAHFAGFGHTDIASKLDLPICTVKGRMRLGLEKARVALDYPAVAAVA